MKKKLLMIILLIVSMSYVLSASAANLLQVYQQGLASDPTFKAAQETYFAAKENFPIALSNILPNISFDGSYYRQHVNISASVLSRANLNIVGDQTFYNNEKLYTLSLTQPIFDYAAWMKIKNADSTVKQAAATFSAAGQDLMLRVAKAYLGVLQANDTLNYTLAQKAAIGRQLKQTKEQYEVGLLAITDYSEAKANYDAILASEIGARNSLATSLEQVRAITGIKYNTLMGLSKNLPLVMPDPIDSSAWVRRAEQQNYTLLSSVYAAQAAQHNIEVQRGGHFPTLNLASDYTSDQNSNTTVLGISNNNTGEVGLTVAVPIYQGGLINAQTTQAEYQFQQALSEMELTHRNVITQARDAFLGVFTGISKIEADRQAIISSETSLKATTEGYQAGTRTILDVLQAESTLYNARITYSQDQYQYLINTLTLKEAAGTLSQNDLAIINSWLKNPQDLAAMLQGIGEYGMTTMLQTNTKTKPKPKPKTKTKTKVKVKAKLKTSQSKPLLTTAATTVTKVKKAAKPEKKPEKTKQVKKKLAESSLPSQTAYTTNEISTKHSKLAAEQLKAITKQYTLVLFSADNRQAATRFMQQHHLKQQAKIVHVKELSGIERYQVVYGEYDSGMAAKEAIQKLPPALQQLKPWVRAISSS